MGGTGKVYCNNCGYREKITSHLHSFGKNPWRVLGYQCQDCGKFARLEIGKISDEYVMCECGGELSREKPLFCKICKSKNIEYSMEFIT